jgi:hypothetical protein
MRIRGVKPGSLRKIHWIVQGISLQQGLGEAHDPCGVLLAIFFVNTSPQYPRIRKHDIEESQEGLDGVLLGSEAQAQTIGTSAQLIVTIHCVIVLMVDPRTHDRPDLEHPLVPLFPRDVYSHGGAGGHGEANHTFVLPSHTAHGSITVDSALIVATLPGLGSL